MYSLQALLLEQDHQEQQMSLEDRVEEMIGYKFRDPILLRQVFTHHSFEEGCSSLERLAYLGDAALSFILATWQYSLYTRLSPGELTKIRAINVDTEKLARAALKNELHKFLRHRIPLLPIQIEGFRNEMKKYPLHSCGLIDAPKVLADIVEALIGAIFIDSNSSMDTTSEITIRLLEPIITPENLPTHPMTKLHEICQKNKLSLVIKDTWKDNGTVEFVVNGRFTGRATYKAKRTIAKTRAALDAYSQVVEALNVVQDENENSTCNSS
ncbi:ribonuclease 3-like protein 3 [Andrographis paniculata]|uniref:ribonuclease 3-like protein 3 n=1 Tax=Andrographis paniculata TaxID=175694 RepID=UPI0021E7BC80|nr:ribonuclease 3-like protein 3 [Andrographis paniculata]